MTLYAFTVKEAEKHTAGSTHHRSDSSRNSEVSVTPILGILVAIGSGLALVAVAIILVLKFRPASPYNNSGSNHHHRRHKERTYLSAPHLPLDRQHREMPEDECIDLEEKDPDIIPTNRGWPQFFCKQAEAGKWSWTLFSADIIEEEEAFQAYAEQRRYASTLGRSCLGSSGTSRRRDIMMTEKGAASSMDGEKIRNLNLKGNFSRLVSLQIYDLDFHLYHLFRVKKCQAMPNGQCQEWTARAMRPFPAEAKQTHLWAHQFILPRLIMELIMVTQWHCLVLHDLQLCHPGE